MVVVFDADGVVAGRLASRIATTLLKGEEVVVLNIEKAVISGNPVRTVKVYFNKRQMTNKGNPEHAKKFPRRPDFFFKKIVAGMMPRTSRGTLGLKRLIVYIGTPKEFVGQGKTDLKKKEALSIRYASIGEIAGKLGFKGF